MRFALLTLPLLMLAAGCERENPPSEKLEKAAEELVGVATPTPTATGPHGPLAPRDECGDVAGAEDFLSALRAAIAMRDPDVLVALAANDVKLGFGGEDGAARLRRQLDAPGSTLWDDLAEVMDMGCAANSQGGITLPWYFAQELPLDAATSMVVTGNDVPLRERPAVDAPVLATVSWEAVSLDVDQRADGKKAPSPLRSSDWRHVRLPATNGTEGIDGYIQWSSLRSPLDHRLLASSRNNRWRITAFVAGD